MVVTVTPTTDSNVGDRGHELDHFRRFHRLVEIAIDRLFHIGPQFVERLALGIVADAERRGGVAAIPVVLANLEDEFSRGRQCLLAAADFNSRVRGDRLSQTMQWSVGPSLADGPLRDGKTWHGGKRQPYTSW